MWSVGMTWKIYNNNTHLESEWTDVLKASLCTKSPVVRGGNNMRADVACMTVCMNASFMADE